MKTCLVIAALSFGLNSFSQFTAIPDANFEASLVVQGYDTMPLDGQVPTSNINYITLLDVSGKNISDLTGIEDFQALQILDCGSNNLSDLDLSQNVHLTELYSLYNPFVCLNIRNGNNVNLTTLHSYQCPNLVCIQVDDYTYSNQFWTIGGSYIFDGAPYFSDYCDVCNVNVNELDEVDFTIYPNPASGSFSVEGIQGAFGIWIYNSIGMLIFESEHVNNAEMINVNEFESGVLFIKIDFEGAVYYRKLLKD